MLTYLAFAIGLVVGAAFHAWHENWCLPKIGEYIVIRKFEYHSHQLIAYNTAREAIEQNPDKFKLLKLKYTGCIIFDNLGLQLKYKSLHGHTLKFNYDMSRFDVVDPPKENCNSL